MRATEGILILMGQTSSFHFSWRLCRVLVVAALIIASLFLPPKLEQLRTGHFEIEHFLAYLAAALIICLGWPRPFLVAVSLIPLAALLEALQSLNPVHSPNVLAALSSIGGALIGALLATLIIRVMDLQFAPKDRRNLDSVRLIQQLRVLGADADWCFVVRKSNTQKLDDIVTRFHDFQFIQSPSDRIIGGDRAGRARHGHAAPTQMDTAHWALGSRALHRLLRHDDDPIHCFA